MITSNLGQRRVDAIEGEGQQLRAVSVGSVIAYPPASRALHPEPEEEGAGSDLRQLLAAARYHRWALVITMGIGGALFAVAATLIPPSFTAVAQIDVAVWPGAGSTLVDSRTNQMVVDTHLVTLKSRDFLRKVLVESLELVPEASGEDNKSGTAAGSLSHEELEWKLEKFAERIAVNQTLSSSVISIGYTSESPERAADVVNLLVSLYRKLLREEEEAAQKGELERLGKRISALQRNIDESRARLLMLLQSRSASGSRPESGSQLAELEAEVHSSAQLLAELLRRQAEARRSLEMIDPKIRIVSLASSPVSRSSLHPALFIGPGVILLLVMSCFWAAAREQWDQRLRSAMDVARALGLPCVGLLPRQKRASLLGRFVGRMSIAPHTEAIRSVAAALDAAAPSRACQIVLLTCSGHDEGKTALAIDIAEYATSLGNRVLLLDLDARTPTLLRKLKVQAAHGVADIVLNDADPQTLVQKCPGISFWFLPMRPSAIDPLTLITSRKLHNALEGFRSSFDLVIVDWPQIAGRADALLIPDLVDKVLFVTKWGMRLQTAKDAVRALRASRQTRASETGAIGCVVTQVPTREHARLQGSVPVMPSTRPTAGCCRASWRS